MIFDIYVMIFLFILGLFLSEFLIVIGLKFPLKNKPIYNICDCCNDKYNWYEMIPLISYFLSKGKCNYCHNKLNLWYIVLEFITAILFSFSYVIYGFSYEMIAFLIILSLLVLIFISDFKYYIILDEALIISGLLILLFKLLFFGFRTFLISVVSGLILFVFIFLIKKIGDKFFGQESLGGGDVKLVAIFGFTLGVRLSIVSLVLGAMLAFPFALYASFTRTEREIPFGPFLISALLFVFVFMEPVKGVLSIIFKVF